jgi:LemA protein
MGILIFLVAVVAIVVIIAVDLYNRLVTLRNRYKNAYAQIN